MYSKRKLVLGVSMGYARFDTNVRFVDENTGDSIYIDAEGHIHRVLKTEAEATDADEASESESPKI